jgi:hypothetical protein
MGLLPGVRVVVTGASRDSLRIKIAGADPVRLSQRLAGDIWVTGESG